MALKYEKIVAEDLNLGVGSVDVTNPAGGTLSGSKINQGTFTALAFAASRTSTQSINSSTLTTVQNDTEDLDVQGWYNPATYKFIPTIAGTYLLIGQATLASFTGTFTLEIYRNGVSIAKHDEIRAAAAATLNLTVLATANGSTDEFTLRVTHTDASAKNISAAFFQGTLIGKAA